jgi:hypothetical protein
MLQRLLGLQTRDALLVSHQARGLEAFQRLFSARPDLAAPAVGRWAGVWKPEGCWGGARAAAGEEPIATIFAHCDSLGQPNLSCGGTPRSGV